MEGDSWLDYLFAKDLQDVLQEKEFETNIEKKAYTVDYKVVSAAHAGDEILKMIFKFDFVKLVKEKEPDIFILSGGGNDILESKVLSGIIKKTKQEGCKDDAFIDCYINKNRLKQRIEIIVASIKIIATELQNIYVEENIEKYKNNNFSIPKNFATIPLFVHGYDYINVKSEQKNCSLLQHIYPGCQWLYPKVKNFPSDIQQKIANHLIDEFNIALEKLSRDPDFQDKVFYIKLLNTVGKNDWSAEIHPSTKGFESLANKMHDGIMKELKKKIK